MAFRETLFFPPDVLGPADFKAFRRFEASFSRDTALFISPAILVDPPG